MAKASSIEEIKNAARYLFAEKGYEATSLYDIAQNVGLRKQSIYAHFKNKDDLFISVIKKAFDEETENAAKILKNVEGNAENILKEFIFTLKMRYTQGNNSNLKIVFRCTYLPPEHLKEQSIQYADNFFSQIKSLLTKIFERSPKINVDVDTAVTAFMTILDGLLISLIYINESRFDEKFKNSWIIFWKGICSE